MKKILLFFLLVAVSITLTSCFKDVAPSDGAGNNTNGTTAETLKETVAVIETQTHTLPEFYKAEGEFIDVVTSYVTLKYPISWDGSVKTEVCGTGTGCIVKFIAYLDYMKIPLYDFVIGESESGLCLGSIETSAGTMQVYLLDYTSDINVSLTESSSMMYRQMGAQVNVIISNLIYESGMVE